MIKEYNGLTISMEKKLKIVVEGLKRIKRTAHISSKEYMIARDILDKMGWNDEELLSPKDRHGRR